MHDARIRVLLVDDHALLRETLSRYLDREPDLHIVGTADDADEGIEKAIALKPSVIVMDIDMPGLLCFDAVRTIKSRRPEVQIIYLSAFYHDRYIEEALAAHATSYVTKDEPPQVVCDAIRRAAAGIAYFSPKVEARLVIDKQRVTLSEPGSTRAASLTQREIEVLRYIARGLSKKDIADLMHISDSTVARHTENIMGKLDIHNRVELARFAIREGLAEA